MRPTRQNLRYSLIDGFAATPWTQLSVPGSFLMAGLLNDFFKLGPFWFGLIAAMPALANTLHILFVRMAANHFRVRLLTLSQGWINLGIWIIGLIGIALLPVSATQTAGWFFLLVFALTSFSAALGNVGWTAWVTDFVPDRIRGRFMARRNRYTNIAMLAYMGLGLLLLEQLDASRTAYLLLAGLAVIGRILSMLAQHGIASPDPTGGVGMQARWGAELRSVRQNRLLLRLILFGAAANFWMAFVGTIYPIYALGELRASPADFTGYMIAATLSGTVCVHLWGKLIDRNGAVPVILLSFVAWRCGDLGWTLLTPATVDWIYLIAVWGGAMGAGYSLACFTLLLKLIPKESTMAGISLNQVASSLASTAAPILAGIVLAQEQALGLDILTTYRMTIAVGLLGGIASIAFLVRTREPRIDPARNRVTAVFLSLRILTRESWRALGRALRRGKR